MRVRVTLPQPTMKHTKQITAFNDPARFKYLLTGRRGGKTTLLKEDIVKSLSLMPPYSDMFYIGPSYQHAMELIWEPLEEALDRRKWKYRPLQSKHYMEFSNNRKVYVIGAEKIRRIRGHKVFRFYMDELGYFEKPLQEAWKAIRPSLSDLAKYPGGGGGIVATTANGKGTDAYLWWEQAKRNPQWRCHKWTTGDNPFMDPEEIEQAKLDMDERSFQQEYMAEWVSFEGLAYYNFDEDFDVYPCEIDYGRPLSLCFDFNVNPTTLLLCQYQAPKIKVLKEYSLKGASTIKTTELFCDDMDMICQEHPTLKDLENPKDKIELTIDGDATGEARKSNTGRSDYSYIKEILTNRGYKFKTRVLAANPPIVDRVNVMNAWMKNVVGDRRIQLDPSCVETIRDLSSQELDGRIPSDKNNLGHKADALGYYVYRVNLGVTRKSAHTIQL